MNLSELDIKQIKLLGISTEKVNQQLNRFKIGFPEIELSGNVEVGGGLQKLSPDELANYIAAFDKTAPQNELVKFVPASGAASRMFKTLHNYLEDAINSEDPEIQNFYVRISNFAFFDELKTLLENFEELTKSSDKKVVEYLLSEQGLNYGKLPKALLTFHKYNDGKTTKAIDEHLIEGANYASDTNGKVGLHFTISEEHIAPIKEHLDKVVPEFETKFNKKFDISFSVQDIATNTLAVDLNNEPFRTDDGKLLFRPGGHGALLKNLNKIDADIIFIKNIDNVAANWLLSTTVEYKKALGGVLLETQNKIFSYCRELDSAGDLEAELENSIISFLETRLGFKVPDDFQNSNNQAKKAYLLEKLNRPLRICGVVESKGTGGGPFWVKHTDGSETLQLVETDQINKDKPAQLHFLNSSNYSNITDLFCGVKNYKGKKFDLAKFSNPDTGFISQKSISGKSLKAMELPGLWNGAMSDWNTAFVEVPMSTFNPVKTVLDLLKKEHQGIQ